MSEVQVMVRERSEGIRAKARARVNQKFADGQVPQLSDLAEARGLVVREREDSIFSDAWTPLALIFIIWGYFDGRNAALLALGTVLLLIVAVSTWWKDRALEGVYYERIFDRTRVFPGEPIEMVIRVYNEKPLPLTWLRFVDELPALVDMTSIYAELRSMTSGRMQLSNTFSIAGNEIQQRRLTLQFPTRGYHHLGPVRYLAGDLFTLFTVERQYRYRQTLVVYPQIYPLTELGMPAKEPFGDLRVRRSLFTDPIKTRGIRDYQPQDRYRDVHWKATARRGTLQTKIYDPSTGMTLAVFLNVATFARHWMGFDPDLLERTISVAASIAHYGSEQGWGVGFYANGSVPRSDQPIRVAPGRSPDQINHVLEALAAVREVATGSIDKLMHRESPRLPWAATLVLVTAVVTEEIAIGLVRLREAGRRVALVSLATEPPEMPLNGILTYRVPAPDAAETAVGLSPTEAALGAVPVPRPVNGAGIDAG